ncbi:MAG: DinB family protein [Leptospirales bacterium]|nr:DinB family protein [Leptospirales bacterium]
MLETIRTLWKYNSWAMERFLAELDAFTEEEFLRELDKGSGSLRDKLAHICGADEVWLRRIQGEVSPAFPTITDFVDRAAVAKRARAVHAEYRALLESLTDSDLNRAHSYKNLKGVDFTTPLWQILMHVANHATYHRGQAASIIRRIKGKPPVTDLIEYFRS